MVPSYNLPQILQVGSLLLFPVQQNLEFCKRANTKLFYEAYQCGPRHVQKGGKLGAVHILYRLLIPENRRQYFPVVCRKGSVFLIGKFLKIHANPSL